MRETSFIRYVFVNGQLIEENSMLEGVEFFSFAEVLKNNAEELKPYMLTAYDEKKFPLAVLNSAFLQNGFFFEDQKKMLELSSNSFFISK